MEKLMRSQLILFMFLVSALATTAQGADSWIDPHANARLQAALKFSGRDTTATVVHAKSYYRNPYFRPNSNYEPQVIGEPEWVENEFSGKLGKPPRPFTDILMPGTYRITTKGKK